MRVKLLVMLSVIVLLVGSTWKPDGTQLLSASSDGTLRLWDTRAP